MLTRHSAEFRDASGLPVERRKIKTLASAYMVDKGNYRHFMAKEIHEQPEVVARTLGALSRHVGRAGGFAFELPVDAKKLSRLTIAGCGTAYFAALTAKYWFERFARLAVDVEIALGVPLSRRAA